MNVFTYGSLMFADVWQAVVTGNYRHAVGQVRGYARRCVKGETYPALIHADAAEVVSGRVYFDIQSSDLRRLDRFEGVYYRREGVTVLLAQGGSIEAQLYLFKERYKGLLDAREWDVAWFEREGLKRFLARYPGFGPRRPGAS